MVDGRSGRVVRGPGVRVAAGVECSDLVDLISLRRDAGVAAFQAGCGFDDVVRVLYGAGCRVVMGTVDGDGGRAVALCPDPGVVVAVTANRVAVHVAWQRASFYCIAEIRAAVRAYYEGLAVQSSLSEEEAVQAAQRAVKYIEDFIEAHMHKATSYAAVPSRPSGTASSALDHAVHHAVETRACDSLIQDVITAITQAVEPPLEAEPPTLPGLAETL